MNAREKLSDHMLGCRTCGSTSDSDWCELGERLRLVMEAEDGRESDRAAVSGEEKLFAVKTAITLARPDDRLVCIQVLVEARPGDNGKPVVTKPIREAIELVMLRIAESV